jgi:hypothetical protein
VNCFVGKLRRVFLVPLGFMDYSSVVRSYSVCIIINPECILPKTNLELTFAFSEQISKKGTSVLPVKFEEREVSSLRVYLRKRSF